MSFRRPCRERVYPAGRIRGVALIDLQNTFAYNCVQVITMTKTVTLRLKDDEYQAFSRAAEGAHRTLSNYVTWATLSYLRSETTVDDQEMGEILGESTDLRKAVKR